MAVQYSIQKMVSDGTLSTIALGIQYLQRNDIYMRVAGEETPQSGAPSGYTWSFLDNTTLKILPVVPNGVEVVVYRRTDVDVMYNIYSQNAQFDEATIDENNQQLLYIAQEYLEQGLPGTGVDTIEYVRDDGSFTYYRMRRTDGSYSEEFTVPSASNSTKVLTRESLRRSYAEAGYNLVDGSFEAGGTLVNASDVLLQESTGKAFSGPAGTVAAGTNPASGGFVDVSGSTTEERSFRSFGVTGLGFADDTAAMQDAIDWAGAKARRRVYGYPGELYRITSGIVLRWDDKPYWDESSACIIDLTGTSFVAGADNITCLKVARNYAKVFNPKVSATGHVGVVAYALAPEDESQTTTRVSQMYCEIHNPEAQNCAVGIRFKPGPTVGGQDSGSFYHTIYSPRFRNVAVGFHFARSSTGSILNTRISIYSPIHVNGHCSFDIEAADSLNVWGGSAEFILNPGQHAGNPTIKVHKPVAGDALASSNISFWGFFGEAGTTPYDFMATESIALVNCTFFAYANDGVNNAYLLNNQLTNEGAVVSRAKYSNSTSPVLAVRREIGSNAGQAFLQYRNQSVYPAVFYADRGFTFTSPIEKCPAVNLVQAQTSTQTFGSTSVTWNASGFNNHVVLRQLAPLADGGWYFQTTADVSAANDDSATLGAPDRRWKQLNAITGVINTCDAREKTAPMAIDDAVLDAWGDVQIVTGQWLESIRQKGADVARWHFWPIAQQVRDAFAARGLDGTRYGLLCYDEWGDEYEPIFEEREVTEAVPDPDSPDGTRTITTTKELPTGESRLVRAAGDRWGIRPDQCLFLEAAYQRRRCDRIEARLSAAGL